MSNTNETIANIMAEMRDDRIIRIPDVDVTRCLLRNLADRIEAAARHQFRMIQSLCQAEIDSVLSDHISAIFMLKVVRDIAQSQISSLSPTEGKEEHNG